VSNRQILVDELEALPLLDGRYESIKWMNPPSASGEKRGCFSLVFRAYDRLEKKKVALKFFDIDPANMMQLYRRQAFSREHEILGTLINRERCIQLCSALSVYNLSVLGPGGSTLTIPCEYFAIEWIDDEIDEYFERQEAFDAIDKLRLLNEIILAVQALHRHEVFHRDIKPDNLRAYQDGVKRLVVAIDLGTAALYSSQSIQSVYTSPVGHGAYAPPEAFCHFAGEREVAPLSDTYALGCLLFELFNLDYFYRAFATRNPRAWVAFTAMEQLIRSAKTLKEKKAIWRQNIGRYAIGLSIPSVEGHGSSVPPGVTNLLDSALQELVAPDFMRRCNDLEKPRRIIWSAIRSLENEADYQRRLRAAKERRRRRIEKARMRDQRLFAVRKQGGK
jgi:serine/threonine protein kinase